MGRSIIKLRDIVGAVKDKVSQSKAILFGDAISLHLSLLRATSHAPHAPPDERHVAVLLTVGDSSRATASTVVGSLVNRMHRTRSSVVAFKCLIMMHHVAKRGPFILKDQMSVFPTTGGRNYLNLSGFRDTSCAATWALSAWVRYYAKYIETLLSTSRTLGFFLGSSSCTQEKEIQEQKLSSITNQDLIRDVDSLVALIEEICQVPDSILLEKNKLLHEVRGLINSDYLSVVNELSLRLSEVNERLSCLSFNDSFELGCILDKLEHCKVKLDELFIIKKRSMEILWDLIEGLRNKFCRGSANRDNNRKLITIGRRERVNESARFNGTINDYGDSVRFSSSRFELNRLEFMVLE